MSPNKTSGSKRLVIDASIARCAGGSKTEASISKICSECLQTVSGAGHRFVSTSDIEAEWNKHQTFFAQTWRRRMVSQKQVVWLKDADIWNSSLRDAIDKTEASNSARQAMEKDVHLLEAATATDRWVISADEAVRRLFRLHMNKHAEARSILWVNPTILDEEVVRWIAANCPSENNRLLIVAW